MTVKDMTSSRPTDTEWHITQEAVSSSSTNIIPKDTIIIATRVGLGKIVRVNFDTTINQDLKALFLNSLAGITNNSSSSYNISSTFFLSSILNILQMMNLQQTKY